MSVNHNKYSNKTVTTSKMKVAHLFQSMHMHMCTHTHTHTHIHTHTKANQILKLPLSSHADPVKHRGVWALLRR